MEAIEKTSSELGLIVSDGLLPRIPSAAEKVVRSWDKLCRSN